LGFAYKFYDWILHEPDPKTISCTNCITSPHTFPTVVGKVNYTLSISHHACPNPLLYVKGTDRATHTQTHSSITSNVRTEPRVSTQAVEGHTPHIPPKTFGVSNRSPFFKCSNSCVDNYPSHRRFYTLSTTMCTESNEDQTHVPFPLQSQATEEQ